MWRSRPPDGLPSDIEEFEAFDLVVFSEAPAADFSDGQMKTLETWVKNFGGAFLMLGGEESFGAGGYFRTSVAGLLPVRIEREEREETPVVALLVILDRSGSMSAPAGGQTKIALANEGAALGAGCFAAEGSLRAFCRGHSRAGSCASRHDQRQAERGAADRRDYGGRRRYLYLYFACRGVSPAARRPGENQARHPFFGRRRRGGKVFGRTRRHQGSGKADQPSIWRRQCLRAGSQSPWSHWEPNRTRTPRSFASSPRRVAGASI